MARKSAQHNYRFSPEVLPESIMVNNSLVFFYAGGSVM